MELIQEFLDRVKTTGPLKTTRGSPDGERNYWIVSHAEIDDPKIKARIAAPDSDWMRVSDDGYWRPDVLVPFQTDDGETVLLHYTEANLPSACICASIRVPSATRWQNASLFVAKGRLLGTGSIEYAVYRIT